MEGETVSLEDSVVYEVQADNRPPSRFDVIWSGDRRLSPAEQQMKDADALRSFPPNPSGIYPTENKVLIEQNAVEETTKGGIIIPDAVKDSKKYAEIEGRIVAQSRLAFNYVTDEEWGDEKPKPGDAIIIAKYSGVRVKGKDGKEYLLVNDKDITALRKE